MAFINKTLLSIGHDHMQEKFLNSFNFDEIILYDYEKIEIKKKIISDFEKFKEYKFYNSKNLFVKIFFFLILNPIKISYLSIKILKTNKYQYFCTGSYSILLITILFSKIFRIKIEFIYIYADWFLNYKNHNNYLYFVFNTKVFKIIEYLINKNTDKFIFYSDELLNSYKNYYKENDTTSKEYFTLNFIDHLKFNSKRSSSKLSSKLKKIKFFFIGNLRDDSDIINFIKYLDQSKIYHFSLDIIGTGELKNDIKNITRNLNKNNSIYLHDFVKDNNIIFDVASKCHFGLALNKYQSHSSFTFPGKINNYFEYMLPIIYSDNLIFVKKYIKMHNIGYKFDYTESVDSFFDNLFQNHTLSIKNITLLKQKLLNKINVNFQKL